MSFLEIFQPGLRHQREERDQQKMLVSKPTHGGGAPLGIDLDAGIATIKIVRPAPATAADDATAETEPAATEPPESSPDTTEQD